MCVCSAFCSLAVCRCASAPVLSASVPHLLYLQLLVDFLNKYPPFAGTETDKGAHHAPLLLQHQHENEPKRKRTLPLLLICILSYFRSLHRLKNKHAWFRMDPVTSSGGDRKMINITLLQLMGL